MDSQCNLNELINENEMLNYFIQEEPSSTVSYGEMLTEPCFVTDIKEPCGEEETKPRKKLKKHEMPLSSDPKLNKSILDAKKARSNRVKKSDINKEKDEKIKELQAEVDSLAKEKIQWEAEKRCLMKLENIYKKTIEDKNLEIEMLRKFVMNLTERTRI